MGVEILTYESIARSAWEQLVERSTVATWWQTPEAYDILSTLPDYDVRVVGVQTDGCLLGLAVVLVTQSACRCMRRLTRRAMVIGGVLIDETIDKKSFLALMDAIRQQTRGAVYVELRPLVDYRPWAAWLREQGWMYNAHLNIQMDTTDMVAAIERIGKSKRRRITTSLQAGVRVVDEPTIEQVKAYYGLLQQLYRRHVRKPLPSWETWEKLYACPAIRYVLIEHEQQIIGGSVCVVWDNKVIYEWYACGRDDARRVISPASLTKWAEIQLAAEREIPLLDLMGAGNPDEQYGVRDFKAEFGGKIIEQGRWLYQHRPKTYALGMRVMRWLRGRSQSSPQSKIKS